MSGIVQILNVERQCLSTFDFVDAIGFVFHRIIVVDMEVGIFIANVNIAKVYSVEAGIFERLGC